MFTTEQQERDSNREFLDSGAGIWCFFEEEAFEPDGELRQDKRLSINKIGHAMHDLDPVFEGFTYTPELAVVAADLGLADALVLQSMYIFKQPRIGGEVGCHQDATFLYTDPMTVTGLLVRDRGRHARERLPVGGAGRSPRAAAPAVPAGGRVTRRRHEVRAARRDPAARSASRPRAARGARRHDGRAPRAASPLERRQPLPVSRHAYSVHCIDAAADYPEWNWLQRPPDMPLRVVVDGPGGRREAGVTTPLTPELLTRAPKALLHDHLDGGVRPATVVELAGEYGYQGLPTTDVDDLAHWFNRGAKRNDLVLYLETFAHTVGVMQHSDAIERVAFECAQDLAADGVVYAEVRMAPELCTEARPDARRGDAGDPRRLRPRSRRVPT